MEIELYKITPSPRNPRKTMSEEALDELAKNIKEQGLLQPITVRPYDGSCLINKDGTTIEYEIVCGERRYKAVKKNADADKDKKATIACIVKEMTEEEAFEAMITENLQRKDVDPIEEAFAFAELIKSGKTVEEVAVRFGKPKRFVQDRCKLNALITPLKEYTTKGVVPIAGAMLLSKVKEELQNKFNDELKERLERNEDLVLDVRDIRSWIQREFMCLNNAKFLEYDDDDKESTEDWNKGQFEKCQTCCMNTGNAGCLFYSMKDTWQYCCDRDCFEKKTAAFWFSEVERIGDGCIIKEGEKIEPGRVLILDDDPEGNTGYDSLKRIRKELMRLIKSKGYMIAPYDTFKDKCKYYGDDERIPKLLEQNKIVKCISLGSQYYIEVEDEYYYVNEGEDVDPQESAEEKEVRELVQKYNTEQDRINDKLDENLRTWCTDEHGKDYAANKSKIGKVEEMLFWVFVLSECGTETLRKIGNSYMPSAETLFPYVKKNLNDENKVMWLRDYLNEKCRRMSTYNTLSCMVMRKMFKEAYPEDFKTLHDKLSAQFEKKTAKIKARLQELGYGANGKKL